MMDDGIVTHAGTTAAAADYRWKDVKEVSSYRWTATLRNGTRDLGGSISLVLDDRTELPINLLGVGGSLRSYYGLIVHALEGQAYRYQTQPSVTPESCPPKIYRAFTHWPLRGE
jgi:hypothetical protein